MHASLQINPYYGRTSIAGVKEHFKRVLDIGPAFIYNVAGRTGQDLTPDIIEPLAQHEHFIGVKEHFKRRTNIKHTFKVFFNTGN